MSPNKICFLYFYTSCLAHYHLSMLLSFKFPFRITKAEGINMLFAMNNCVEPMMTFVIYNSDFLVMITATLLEDYIIEDYI